MMANAMVMLTEGPVVLAWSGPHSRTDKAVAATTSPKTNHRMTHGRVTIFVPGVRDAETIGRLVRAIDGPLNVLAGPGTPAVSMLAALGVARVSAGSGTMRAALTAGLRAIEEMRDSGTYGFTENILTHAEVNALLSPAK